MGGASTEGASAPNEALPDEAAGQSDEEQQCQSEHHVAGDGEDPLFDRVRFVDDEHRLAEAVENRAEGSKHDGADADAEKEFKCAVARL